MANLHDISLRSQDRSRVLDRDRHFTGDYSPLSAYQRETWQVGDIIRVREHVNYDYRNGGKLLWTGTECVPLDYDIDDYGSVSKQFPIGNNSWTAHHWRHVIDHNRIVYASFNPEINALIRSMYRFNEGITDEIQTRHNIQMHDREESWDSYGTQRTVSYRTLRFTYMNRTWGIILHSSEDYTTDEEPWDHEPFTDLVQPAAFCYLNGEDHRYYRVPGVQRNHTLFYGYLD